MAEVQLHPTDGHILAGVVLDPHTFEAKVKVAQLFTFTENPVRTEDRKQLAVSPELEIMRKLRVEVQRLFEGEKKRNVTSYARYIVNLHRGATGLTPTIVLWTQNELKFAEGDNGTAHILIPFEYKLIAIDGETQLAARYEAAGMEPETKRDMVAVKICHHRDPDWARQVFYDLNVLGVQPSSALAISMDARDPLTSVARDVERQVSFLQGKINKVRRQLKRSDPEIMTITNLRGACVTLAKGISGVKFGTKPVPMESQDVPRVREVAVEWFTAVTDLLGPAMIDRDRTVAAAPPVLAAIGAMANELLAINERALRKRRIQELLEKLRTVQWEKGPRWEGILGKFTPSGVFSIGGTKETVYQVFAALDDPTSAAFRQVRPSSASAA
jgi:DGQHR domain-containing protein